MTSITLSAGRQVQAIGLIGFGHFLSHFYQLALPPLFLFMRDDFGVSFVELGATLVIYNIATATLQTPVGFLVDRIGARNVLAAGLFLNGLAFVLAGLTSDYWTLAALMFLAGVGNSVFHPADYSLLSSSVNKDMLGRAFSIHAFGGSLGFMAAPIVILLLADMFDWRTALWIVGAVGVGLAILLPFFGHAIREQDGIAQRGAKKAEGPKPGLRDIATRPILMFLLFYIASAAAGSGVSSFALVALVQIYGVTEALAGGVISLFFGTIAVAVLFGGWLADKAKRHDLVLLVTYGLTAVMMALIGSALLPFWLVIGAFVIAGTMRGVVNPTRDVLVRRAAPAGAVGAVFGFVTTGFSIGQGTAPLLYGWLMDLGQPELVFWVAAGFTVIAVGIILISRERGLYEDRTEARPAE